MKTSKETRLIFNSSSYCRFLRSGLPRKEITSKSLLKSSMTPCCVKVLCLLIIASSLFEVGCLKSSLMDKKSMSSQTSLIYSSSEKQSPATDEQLFGEFPELEQLLSSLESEQLTKVLPNFASEYI